MKRLLGFLLPALSSEDKPEGIYIKLECPQLHSYAFFLLFMCACLWTHYLEIEKKKEKREKPASWQDSNPQPLEHKSRASTALLFNLE